VSQYFRSPIPDPLQAGISPQPLNRQLFHQTHTSVDLNCI
ncbi:uncharacterized protein METZ01_LOCUS195009, partial [marine metagenome]